MRHYKITSLVLACILMVVFAPAHAQEKHMGLNVFESKGFSVEPLGNAFGVDGWIIRNDAGQVQYAYTTPEGGLITGLLFAPDGTLYTSEQVAKFRKVVDQGSQEALEFADDVEKSNAPRSERIYAEIEAAKWFSVGDENAPYIYTFMNPTCSHCVDFWTGHMKQLVDDGHLQIRFIPFGAQDANREASALLLMADNADDIWRAYAAGDQDAYTKAAMTVPEGIYDAVEVNTGLYRKLKLSHVPFTIYRAPADGKIKIIAGVPENTMMVLADFVR